jgi:hypothetical protein
MQTSQQRIARGSKQDMNHKFGNLYRMLNKEVLFRRGETKQEYGIRDGQRNCQRICGESGHQPKYHT